MVHNSKVNVGFMIKRVAIVSLSYGIMGEESARHEVEIGIKRLRDYGLEVKIMPHADKGIDYVKNHPKERAEDLLAALSDDSIDMILCAIGGDDTYRLLPYLFGNDELKNAVKEKIFLGFSDTTINHLMLHKVGLNTFYGQSFLSDICEMEKQMLPYTAKYFEELIKTGTIKEITPSDVWYEERTDWSSGAVGTPRKAHKNNGFELLQGYLDQSGGYLTVLMKVVGITYICEFSAAICKDAGYGAVAGQIEILGKLSVVFAGLPVLFQVIEQIEHLA